jgi:hypothetical protein
MSFQWQITPEQAFMPLYAQYAEELEAEIVALCERLADEITEYMKENAPWQDRTGEARASLYTLVEHEARQMVSILLSHGSLIPYGVYLELSYGGQYAIIAPTIDWYGPRLFHEVQAIVERVRVGG